MATKTKKTGIVNEGTSFEYPRIPTQEELDAFREELRGRTAESIAKVKSAPPGMSFGIPESQRGEAELAPAQELPWGAKERPATVEAPDKVKRFSNMPEYAEDPSVTYIEEAEKKPDMTDPRQTPVFQHFKSALVEQIGFDPTTYNPYQIAMDAVGGDPDLDPERFQKVYDNAKLKKASAMDVWDYAMSQFDKEETKRIAKEKELKATTKAEEKERKTKAENKNKDSRALSDKNIKLSEDMQSLQAEMEDEEPGSDIYKNMEQRLKLMQDQYDMNAAELGKLQEKPQVGPKDRVLTASHGQEKAAYDKANAKDLKTKEEVVAALRDKKITDAQARQRLSEILPDVAKKVKAETKGGAPGGIKGGGNVTVKPVQGNPEMEAISEDVAQKVSDQLSSKFSLEKPPTTADEAEKSPEGMPIPPFYRNMKK